MARSFCAVALSAASYGWGLSTTLLNWTRVCVTNNTNTQTKGARAIARAVIVHTLRTLPPHTNTGAQAHMQALMGVCVCKIVCRCHDAGIFGTVPNQGRVRRLPSSAFDCCPENAYKLCVVVVVGVCVSVHACGSLHPKSRQINGVLIAIYCLAKFVLYCPTHMFAEVVCRRGHNNHQPTNQKKNAASLLLLGICKYPTRAISAAWTYRAALYAYPSACASLSSSSPLLIRCD